MNSMTCLVRLLLELYRFSLSLNALTLTQSGGDRYGGCERDEFEGLKKR